MKTAVPKSLSLSRSDLSRYFDLDNWQTLCLINDIIMNWSSYEEEPDEFFQHQKEENTRFSRADGYAKRPAGAEPQKG